MGYHPNIQKQFGTPQQAYDYLTKDPTTKLVVFGTYDFTRIITNGGNTKIANVQIYKPTSIDYVMQDYTLLLKCFWNDK